MLYRLSTEDSSVFRQNVVSIVSRFFDGFSLIPCLGFWQGKPENSIIIEIIADNELPKIRAIADEIRIANKQESVLISWGSISYEFRGV